MVYYLRHPQHGTKVAVLDLEMQFDLENGWELYDPASSTESVEIEAASVNNLGPKRRRKASVSSATV